MPRISFEPDDLDVEGSPQESVLQTAIRQGIGHYHVCGGQGRCSTCRVLVVEGEGNVSPRTARESAMAGRLGLGREIRLACQTRVLGPVTVRRLVLDPQDVRLATAGKQKGPRAGPVGEERSLAILFADIRGFTGFSEGVPAYDVIHVLDRWFHAAQAAIEREGGVLENTMGDGLLALFGLDGAERCAVAAIRAGVALFDVAEALRAYVADLYDWTFDIRVGVHRGEVVVGALGTGKRRRVAVIGDAVNFASRIEGANKEVGTRFLASDEVRREAGDAVRWGRSVLLEVAGKRGRHRLHEVCGLAEGA